MEKGAVGLGIKERATYLRHPSKGRRGWLVKVQGWSRRRAEPPWCHRDIGCCPRLSEGWEREPPDGCYSPGAVGEAGRGIPGSSLRDAAAAVPRLREDCAGGW